MEKPVSGDDDSEWRVESGHELGNANGVSGVDLLSELGLYRQYGSIEAFRHEINWKETRLHLW